MAGSAALGKWVTRLFAGLGVLAALAILAIAVTLIGFAWRAAPQRAEAPIQGAASEAERFAVAEVGPLAGTELQAIVIATKSSIGGGGGSYSSRGGAPDARNLILLHQASGANRRLLADNRRHIAARYYLPALAGPQAPGDDAYQVEENGKRVAAPLAYYVLVVDALDRKTQDVLIGDLRDGRQAFVLTGIDGLDRLWMQSPTRMGVLMRQGQKLRYRAIDLTTLKPVAAQDVDIG